MNQRLLLYLPQYIICNNNLPMGLISWWRNSSREILRAKYGWLQMDDSSKVSHSFNFDFVVRRHEFCLLSKRNSFSRNLIPDCTCVNSFCAEFFVPPWEEWASVAQLSERSPFTSEAAGSILRENFLNVTRTKSFTYVKTVSQHSAQSRGFSPGAPVNSCHREVDRVG